MVGAVELVPQLHEQRVLDFNRAEIAVAFFLDLCSEDLDTLEEYYKRGLKNASFIRMQNTMRVRQNDKYRDSLEEEIARLENRWAAPLAKVTNVFESATRFTSVPPGDVKGATPESGVELKAVEDTDIQDKRRWIEEDAVVQLKALGVKPYREAMKRLRQLRHRRSQYRYLELYLFNLGRQVINLQSNLRLVLAVIDVIKRSRKILGEDFVNNPIGSIVKEIIAGNDLDDSVTKLKDLQLDKILGDKGTGGAAGTDGQEKPGDTASQQGKARNSQDTVQDPSSGIGRSRGGSVPSAPPAPPTAGPTGVNPRQSATGRSPGAPLNPNGNRLR